MKKMMYVLLLVLVMIGLSACSGQSVSENLQEGKWNIVSTNGESYTGEFGEDTVTFKLGSFNRGFTYTMEGEEIHMVEGSEEPVIFEVEKMMMNILSMQKQMKCLKYMGT